MLQVKLLLNFTAYAACGTSAFIAVFLRGGDIAI
jgi:hypothetical protein